MELRDLTHNQCIAQTTNELRDLTLHIDPEAIDLPHTPKDSQTTQHPYTLEQGSL